MEDGADIRGGALERPEDAGKGQAGLVSLWLDAIALAGREEADWREKAGEALRVYRSDEKERTRKRFNILYSNVETIAPAVYSSVPAPDVRRRFADDDPTARVAAQVLERGISAGVDGYAFDAIMRRAVKDCLITGRGVSRVIYEPVMQGEALVYESVRCESVHWSDFRRGPARAWEDTPWIAFRHYLTREEVERLNPRIGSAIDLDAKLDGVEDKEGQPPPQIFQRATVWEVWDKERRRVLFIAPAWRDAPLMVVDDPLGLAEFYPVPSPLYAVDLPDSLVPIEPYRFYRDLAEELDQVTKRIKALTSALKWRGAYADPSLGDFLTRFEKLADGEFAPMDNAGAFASGGGGVERAFWLMPIEQAANVLQQLYVSREQIKAAIYEITGISDIVRGASVATETATAQQIKSQWGSLRIQRLQAEVQRFARDLFRLKAEIMAEKFEPQSLQMISGIEVTPKIAALLRSDALRTYRVDIETDSTIQGDVSRIQNNMNGFLQSFGGFLSAIGPAVQQGAIPMDVAKTIAQSMARAYKLGRSVEDALDTLGQQAPAQDPNAQAQQQQQQAEAQAKQAEAQARQEELRIKQEQAAADAALKREQLTAQERMKDKELSLQEKLERRKIESQERLAGINPAPYADEVLAQQLGQSVEQVGQALQQVDQTVQQVGQMVQQVAAQTASLEQAVRTLAAEQAAPVAITARDPDGRAAVVQKGRRTLRVVRGPDGLAAGLQPVATQG